MLKLIKKIGKFMVCRFLPQRYLIFESVPDLSDNTKAVFDEMVKRGINKKYTCVWLVSNSRKEFPQYLNTIYVDDINDSKRFMYYKLRAKSMIFCNTLIQKANEKTKSFYLTHATQIKDSSSYYLAPDDIDYCFVTAQAFEKLMSRVYGVEVGKMVSLGFPRNDVFYKCHFNLNNILQGDYEKIIVWYPTFRQSKGGRIVENCECLPIIHDEQQAILVNRVLVEHNILIILKPHFAQDVKFIKDLKLSNILFIDDTFFEENKITSYQLVASCDALLTDYSSIYFDFLACDKPIGVVWEDIDFYRKNRGFCLDVDYYLKGAEKIYSVEDFVAFLERIANDVDMLKKERTEIRKLAHENCDGNNTQRVVDFIIDKASL